MTGKRLLEENVSLKDYSFYQIGGPAGYFLRAKNVEELSWGLKIWQQKFPAGRVFVLGSGTNVLFDDRGFGGLVIHPEIKFIQKTGKNSLEVGAAAKISELLKYAVDNSLSGLEWAGGLPGTVGGAIFGNAGAFGAEFKGLVLSVKSFSLKNCRLIERSQKECQFNYRSSIFKMKFPQEEIIVSAKLKFQPGNRDQILKEIEEKNLYRKKRQPLEYPSLGSTFKNVPLEKIPLKVQSQFKDKIKNDPFPLIPAAVFLSAAGLKGARRGGIEISPKHPNFFVNSGQGKAREVRALIEFAQRKVKEKFGCDLETEIIEAGRGL